MVSAKSKIPSPGGGQSNLPYTLLQVLQICHIDICVAAVLICIPGPWDGDCLRQCPDFGKPRGCCGRCRLQSSQQERGRDPEVWMIFQLFCRCLPTLSCTAEHLVFFPGVVFRIKHQWRHYPDDCHRLLEEVSPGGWSPVCISIMCKFLCAPPRSQVLPVVHDRAHEVHRSRP